jgi:CHAT domain-containing protein
LSQLLLGPVADKIGNKRLLIVGDGVLHYLPFGALPSPSAGGAHLIEEHEIVYLPSASVLSILRSETANRKPGPLSVAVIANPVFTADDERVKIVKQSVAPKQVSTNHNNSPRLRSGLELVPLPATELEAEAISAAIGNRGRTKIAKDFDANRATVMKLQTEQYRIIHFATHGDLDTEHPELSAIVLSLFDSQGRDLKDDGFLRLHDIYNMKLPADMIVLSACKTGLGQMLKGEGLIGLTRGFMHAGSPRRSRKHRYYGWCAIPDPGPHTGARDRNSLGRAKHSGSIPDQQYARPNSQPTRRGFPVGRQCSHHVARLIKQLE